VVVSVRAGDQGLADAVGIVADLTNRKLMRWRWAGVARRWVARRQAESGHAVVAIQECRQLRIRCGDG
jgi:hypothetical protein